MGKVQFLMWRCVNELRTSSIITGCVSGWGSDSSERTLIQAHLSYCTVCQQKLSLLSTARSRVRSMLQRRAVHAVPSAEAWNRLEASLTEAEQLSSKKEARFSSWAPN